MIRKNLIKEIILFTCLFVLSFIPFYIPHSYNEHGVSLFNFFNSIFYILKDLDSYSQQTILIKNATQLCIDVVCLYLLITMLIMFALVIKQGKYRYYFNLSAILCLILNFSFKFAVYNIRLNYEAILTWAFYLSIILLIAYAFSPLYYKKLITCLRKTYANFRSTHPRKPTKAERIAQLEREVEELKKTQDESIDISSDNEKGSD